MRGCPKALVGPSLHVVAEEEEQRTGDGGDLQPSASRTPILGFVPLGLAFGALAAQSGLEWWWAGLSAALAFGGSFEFLLIGLVSAAAPLAAIALSTFMVNVRHVF